MGRGGADLGFFSCAAADDTKAKEKIEAKNSLENYAYSIRNTIRDEKLAGKLSAESKAKAEEAVNTTIAWLEKNATAEKEEFAERQKELEGVINPIMQELYAGAGGAGGMPGGMPGGFPGGGFPGAGGAGGFPGGGFPGAGGAGGDAGAGGGGKPSAGPKIEEVRFPSLPRPPGKTHRMHRWTERRVSERQEAMQEESCNITEQLFACLSSPSLLFFRAGAALATVRGVSCKHSWQLGAYSGGIRWAYSGWLVTEGADS